MCVTEWILKDNLHETQRIKTFDKTAVLNPNEREKIGETRKVFFNFSFVMSKFCNKKSEKLNDLI